MTGFPVRFSSHVPPSFAVYLRRALPVNASHQLSDRKDQQLLTGPDDCHSPSPRFNSGMPEARQKITFGEMRAGGVRGLLLLQRLSLLALDRDQPRPLAG
jgi:hypothetical protein